MLKRGNYYFMLTSACTGWTPNQGKYAYTTSIIGRWSSLRDIGDAATYDTQPTYVIPIEGDKGTSYLYVGDRWDGRNYYNSTYVFLPLEFPTENTMILKNVDQISIDLKEANISVKDKM